MGLVDHPIADLALLEDGPYRRVPELLGRDQQNGGIAHPDTVERIVALGQRQESVDRDAGGDPVPAQTLHLIGHQRDERRDHHRERPGLLEPGQCRDLVADRLARARWQNAEDGLAPHGLCNDLLLERRAILALRFGSEFREAEPAGQMQPRIILGAAPGAGRIIAGVITEPPHERACLGKGMAHPGRHHRVTARDGDPGKRVGKRPAMLDRFGKHSADLMDAGFAV